MYGMIVILFILQLRTRIKIEDSRSQTPLSPRQHKARLAALYSFPHSTPSIASPPCLGLRPATQFRSSDTVPHSYKIKKDGSQSEQGCPLVSWLTKRAGVFPCS